jgi:hypothetical protein
LSVVVLFLAYYSFHCVAAENKEANANN